MFNLENHLDSTQQSAIRLGSNHGYRISGDVAALNVELSVLRDDAVARRDFALQLWACERPHTGGALAGFKVAEAALQLDAASGAEPQFHGAFAYARPPAGQRDYAMVLVLASGHDGTFDHVHDFANYPARERFVAPHLDGEIGYGIDDESVLLRAERIRNPRAADNLSGSLALELWALAQPYTGGAFEGMPLAGVELGQLAGQAALEKIEAPLALRRPPDGEWKLVLMLREWTQAGYVTRDYCNFATPYRWATRPLERRPTLVPVPAAQPATVKVAAEPPRAAAAEPVKAKPAVPAAHAVTPGTPAPVAAPAPAPAAKAAPAPAVAPATAAPAANADTRISIQTASVDELAQIEGLNKRLAAEIIKARPYTSLDQLSRVRGIGDKTLRKLRTLLKV